MAVQTASLFDWVSVLGIVVFWGWLLLRVLRRHTNPRLKWLVICSVVVIGLLLLRNIYLAVQHSS